MQGRQGQASAQSVCSGKAVISNGELCMVFSDFLRFRQLVLIGRRQITRRAASSSEVTIPSQSTSCTGSPASYPYDTNSTGQPAARAAAASVAESPRCKFSFGNVPKRSQACSNCAGCGFFFDKVSPEMAKSNHGASSVICSSGSVNAVALLAKCY